jgi:penicillin-binding protein 1C
VTLVELTAAASVFARRGRWLQPLLYERIEFADGRVERPRREAERPVLRPETAWLVSDMLADPIARVPAFGRGGPLELPFAASVKTGTSKGYRDNWAVGWSERYTVGVWVGNFDGRPMADVSGVSGAAPLWHALMLWLHRGEEPALPPRPPGQQRREVCVLSGHLPGPSCAERAVEYFPRDRPLPGICPLHRLARVERASGLLAGPACPAAAVEERVFLDLPVGARAWGRRTGRALLPEAWSPRCPGETGRGVTAVRVVEPHPDAVFRRDSRLPASAQQIELRAESEPPGQGLLWTVDGEALGSVIPAGRAVRWGLRRGRHRLEARLAGSELRDGVWITVLEPGEPEPRPESGEQRLSPGRSGRWR